MAEKKGREGENEIIQFLRKLGVFKIRKPDIVFLHPKTKKWYCIEVKGKEPFSPPPDWLQGFPQSQFLKDIHLDAIGLPVIYVVRGLKEGQWLAQYANSLNPYPKPPHANISEDLVWFDLAQFLDYDKFFRYVLDLGE